jgi:hypothetical protein
MVDWGGGSFAASGAGADRAGRANKRAVMNCFMLKVVGCSVGVIAMVEMLFRTPESGASQSLL